MFKVLLFIINVNYVSFNANNEKIFNYVGRGEEMYLKRGKYHINIYGAQGGYGYGDGVKCGIGGRGMLIKADFYITAENPQLYYVFVGEAGVPNDNDPGLLAGPNRGGFNGGGSGGIDLIWNPSEDQNDGAGGGGGATDIRLNKDDYMTRLIVASGGSGGSWEDGNPGGEMCGLTRNGWKAKLECSETTNTYVPTGGKCVNKNGIGGKGKDSTGTPRSGGGGGYCGGDSTIHDKYEPFVSDSGSSYVKKCSTTNLGAELCFYNVEFNQNSRNGNGMLVIKRYWECQDSNCLFCKEAANKCETCKSKYLRYNGKCVLKCPTSTIQKGIDCYDCKKGCYECVGETYICKSCISGYYLYHYECMKKCPETTTIQGKNCVDCEKPCYTCSDTIDTCTYCIAGYYLHNKKCVSECPKGFFEDDLTCSPCDEECANCSKSSDFCHECKMNYFLYNNKCYLNCADLNNAAIGEYYGKNNEEKTCQKCNDVNCIDCSMNYKKCSKCAPLYYLNQTTFACIHVPTNIFSSSAKFSDSLMFSFSSAFSQSSDFSKTFDFSSSNSFSQSNHFLKTINFTKSNYFTVSNAFSKSSIFLQTAYFIFSNEFSKSIEFSQTTSFTFSNKFTDSHSFSHSKEFSNSNTFTESNSFTAPFRHQTSISVSISLSYILKKSVSYSISYFASYIYSMTNMNGEVSLIPSKSSFSFNLPYIIQIYSQSYVRSIIIYELHRPKITQEMLIAICCGFASIFFLILAIIIMIFKKIKENKSNDFYMFSDNVENDNNENQQSKSENTNLNIDLNDCSDNDLNFWL